MTEQSATDGSWGDSDGPPPQRDTTQVDRFRLEKFYQIIVLCLFCAFTIIMAVLEVWPGIKAGIKDLLPLALPLFTFVLGMASQVKDKD